MTALIITDDVRADINKMIERAEKHPLPMARIIEGAVDGDLDIVHLSDRKPGYERPRSEHMIIPMGFRVAISIEEQPAGWCKHLSISVPMPGKVPSQEAAMMIADAFGFHAIHKVWLEEFDPGHMAINMIFVYRPTEAHRA